MAVFYDDPAAHYDAPGMFYDSVPERKKVMAKVKLSLGDYDDVGLLQKANSIKTAMTGNATFTTPIPTLTAYAALITAAQTALNEHNAAQAAALMKTTAKDEAMAALRGGTTQLGTYVEAASGGDAVKIQSTNMEVQLPRAPIGVPERPASLALADGDADGELNANWSRVRGARSYEIQLSPDPITATSWTNRPSVTKAGAKLGGLTSGQKVWVQVRAMGAAGPSGWSDPATKIVP